MTYLLCSNVTSSTIPGHAKLLSFPVFQSCFICNTSLVLSSHVWVCHSWSFMTFLILATICLSLTSPVQPIVASRIFCVMSPTYLLHFCWDPVPHPDIYCSSFSAVCPCRSPLCLTLLESLDLGQREWLPVLHSGQCFCCYFFNPQGHFLKKSSILDPRPMEVECPKVGPGLSLSFIF